jgi:hypothetical protein
VVPLVRRGCVGDPGVPVEWGWQVSDKIKSIKYKVNRPKRGDLVPEKRCSSCAFGDDKGMATACTKHLIQVSYFGVCRDFETCQ